MAPPIIKQIELLSDKKENIFQFLSEHNFNERPTVISLLKFKDTQEQLISILEEFFEEKSFIYPAYILTTMIEYPTTLNMVESLNQVPKFYRQKSKQLNIKENLVFNKIKLKQEQLKSINQEEIGPILREYSKEHKIINDKELFNNYMKKIIHAIRTKHDT